MKTVTIIARILLGLIFTVFGLNGFLHFLPMPPEPKPAGDFFGALMATGYMIQLIFLAQVVGGVLVLIGIAVPFGLVILATVIVNIFFFHVFLAPGGIPLAAVIVLLELFLAWRYREAFAPLFVAKAPS